MQKGRIIRGAKVAHGDHYGCWPTCMPPNHEYFNGGYDKITKFPDAVFDVVWVEGGDQYYWECTRFGYGLHDDSEHDGFGNGTILVFGKENVELIND